MTYADILARRINDLRKERGISLNKLATLSGAKQSTLDNIIKGHTKNPSIGTLDRVAQGFGITVSQFLDFPEMNEMIIEEDE